MMREKVCVVLNEREPPKRKAAEALEAKLLAAGITVSRVEIDEHIVAVLHERSPKILVIDYLIGDYSTGLDILSSFSDTDESIRPDFIFLTDEPSVHVAVEAMRAGALNYFELDHPQSVKNTAELIIETLGTEQPEAIHRKAVQVTLSDLIAHAPATLQTVQQARSLAAQHTPITVVYGPEGSGLSTFASALAHEFGGESCWRELNLRTFDAPMSEFFGLGGQRTHSLRLGCDLSAIVSFSEEDDGELLDLITDRHEQLWPSSEQSENDSYLIICTTCEATKQSWERLTGAAVLEIPSLAARREDVSALIQRFVLEAEQLISKKVKPFDADVIAWMATLDWPGEVRELWSVVLETAVARTFRNDDTREIIEQAKVAWEEQRVETDESIQVDPFVAASMLERCGHRYRIAAARLGCSVKKLQQIIRSGMTNGSALNGSAYDQEGIHEEH